MSLQQQELVEHSAIAIDQKNDHIVDQIMKFRNKNNVRLIDKFNENYLMSIIEREKITQLEREFSQFEKKGVDIIDFVRMFLKNIEHDEEETVFMVVTLVQVFRKISESLDMASLIRFDHLTDYICQNYSKDFKSDNYQIDTKRLPQVNHFRNEERMREIDLEPPVVYGQTEEKLRRLMKDKVMTDSSPHNSHGIKFAHYSSEIQKVFTLDSLSFKINFYDLDCQLIKYIQPKQSKDHKEVLILSFAWSNKQKRLGAVLKDFTIVFWDYEDNFEFQKKFSSGGMTFDYQNDIWYIEYLDRWLTTDRSCCINSWDLETEVVDLQIRNNRVIKSQIIGIEEIPFMKLCAVGSLDKQVSIWNIKNKLCILRIDLTKKGGIQQIKYFRSYQVLLTFGYENQISIFSIDPEYNDYSQSGNIRIIWKDN